jgi:hypothetical protein
LRPMAICIGVFCLSHGLIREMTKRKSSATHGTP